MKQIKSKSKSLLNLIIFSLIIIFNIKKYNPEQYFNLCNNTILLFKKKLKKVKKPKISVISPIHNKEKYILRLLRSIQNQNFQSLEIIFVDDCSKDNSVGVIEKYLKEDERIIILKHKKNRGTFVSRNEGALISKGEYLIFADPDDILIYDIFKYSYKTAKKGNYDIVRFDGYIGNGEIIMYSLLKDIQENRIYQPKLSLYAYYGLDGLEKFNQNDFFIWNKLIKRNIYISSLNSINKYYINKYIIDCEDGLMNFILYRKAKSLYYLKKAGYYYIQNEKSITNKSKINLIKRLSSNFLYFRFVFQYSKNNYIEKNIADNIFLNVYFLIYNRKMIQYLKLVYNKNKIYEDVINLYLSSNFISLKTKKIMEFLKFHLN